ncbi:MAG: RtcB family protein [Chloroflexi bacterium]|nr:RtcB family protein [Chloroflexota bacterium]
MRQEKRGYVKLCKTIRFSAVKDHAKNQRNEHPILDDPRWRQLPHHLNHLHEKAAEQLGTSGGGNHFVEWVSLAVQEDNPLDLEGGNYIALVSHSGSRAVGFTIANWYTKVAEQYCAFLPKEFIRLAWLEYQTSAAEEYELAMNLAGDFARANHEVIHQRISEALGADLVLATLENHHNFAWRVERPHQAPIYIHRKGATPPKDVLGIIRLDGYAGFFARVGRDGRGASSNTPRSTARHMGAGGCSAVTKPSKSCRPRMCANN